MNAKAPDRPAGQKRHASLRGSNQGASGAAAGRPRKPAPQEGAEGLSARDAAVDALSGVLREGRSFDDVLSKSAERRGLQSRDRAFARAVAAAALRNRGALLCVVGKFLEKPLPKDTGRLEPILLAAAAQLLILETPPHAAISLAVDQTRADSRARRFDKLTNAVLRRVAEKGAGILESLDTVALNIPAWLASRWEKAYGREQAMQIARASLTEAALDISVTLDPQGWAERLGGQLLSTGSVRLAPGGRIEDLPGFAEGAWWVQDAAAALPVKLLGDVRGARVADVCAAPGGKTAQLAAGGAHVTAVDQSAERLERLRSNLKRLHLSAETAVADATTWTPAEPFDAILVDAPCTATGTIRRHPDILHLKRASDAAHLAAVQARMLDAAGGALKRGGRLVYCTCSLEPEEGPDQVQAFLRRNGAFARVPIKPEIVGGETALLTADGDLRTFPYHFSQLPPGLRGLDGFYAAVLHKTG